MWQNIVVDSMPDFSDDSLRYSMSERPKQPTGNAAIEDCRSKIVAQVGFGCATRITTFSYSSNPQSLASTKFSVYFRLGKNGGEGPPKNFLAWVSSGYPSRKRG